MASKFFARYSDLCKSNGETPNSVAKAIGASSGSVTAWKNGTVPRSATLSRIADHFNVTTDYLLGNTDSKVRSIELFDGIGGMSSTERAMLDTATTILSRKEKAPTVSGERTVDLSEVDFAFYGGYKELDEQDQETIRDMVRIMRERRAAKQENK